MTAQQRSGAQQRRDDASGGTQQRAPRSLANAAGDVQQAGLAIQLGAGHDGYKHRKEDLHVRGQLGWSEGRHTVRPVGGWRRRARGGMWPSAGASPCCYTLGWVGVSQRDSPAGPRGPEPRRVSPYVDCAGLEFTPGVVAGLSHVTGVRSGSEQGEEQEFSQRLPLFASTLAPAGTSACVMHVSMGASCCASLQRSLR